MLGINPKTESDDKREGVGPHIDLTDRQVLIDIHFAEKRTIGPPTDVCSR